MNRYARVVDGIVKNIELANEEWIKNQNDSNTVFVLMQDDDIAHIGLSWTKENGFELHTIKQYPKMDIDQIEDPEYFEKWLEEQL